jgi:hypothetical protein
MKTDLTQARLRELFHYDPDTGVFHWQVAKTGVPRRRNGLAGSVDAGYVRIKVDGHQYRAHRLVWLYVHGVWPDGEIDHINRNRSDNRLCNLRDVSFTTNQQNQSLPTKNNKAGFLGVHRAKGGRFVAQIECSGHNYYLGRFDTPELAHEAYVSAKRVLHKGCAI